MRYFSELLNTWTDIQFVIKQLEEKIRRLLSSLRNDAIIPRRHRRRHSRRTFSRLRRSFCVALFGCFDEVDVGERLAFWGAVVWRHAVVQVSGEAVHDDFTVSRVFVGPTLKD